MSENLIDIRSLKKYYPVTGGVFRHHVADVKAVDGVDLAIRRGECLGLVGESGCGKTTLGKTVLRLHPATSGRIYYDAPTGQIEETERLLRAEAGGASQSGADPMDFLRQADITKMKGRRLKKLRQKVQIVFQDPSNSLSPRMLIKHIVAEPLVAQGLIRPREVEGKVRELLDKVGLAGELLMRYPHEFSGGQRQRIAIARALATNPEFVLMDEPTSALDVSVQAQILNLLKQLQGDLGLTYLFVTHHLLVVKYMSDRIAVMYLGRIVELGPTAELFAAPRHPYTRALLSAIPIPDPDSGKERIILTGDVPNPVNPPAGCRFHPRCSYAKDVCREVEPALEIASEGGAGGTAAGEGVPAGDHQVACHRWKEI